VGERRNVAEDERRAACGRRREKPRFVVRTSIEIAIEHGRPSRRVGDIHREAVGLRHANVRLESFVRHALQPRELEDPPRRHRLHDDARVRLRVEEGANQLEASGGVAKTMPRHIENDAIRQGS
jgi:hypothetical protein